MGSGDVAALVKGEIVARSFPGAAFAFGNKTEQVVGYAGTQTYDASSPEIGPETLWDLASLTKVIATTSVAMSLWEEGMVDLEQPVREILPEYRHPETTVRDLLEHKSGLIAHRLFHEVGKGWDGVFDEPHEYEPRSKAVYSCVGFLVLYRALCVLLESESFQERFVAATGLRGAMHNPPPEARARCAPTEVVAGYREGLLQGEVHDENCHYFGGISGNAGLFATLDDVRQYAVEMLVPGRQFHPDTIASWTKRQSEISSRALGWDTWTPGCSGGTLLSPKSFGHTGFTGTSIWVDPENEIYGVLLTNRVHPTRTNEQLLAFRPRYYDSVVQALA